MFSKFAILALAGAAAVSALDSRAVHEIVSRQLSASDVPSACTSSCSSALTIYNACLNGDSSTCLTVCQPDTYSGFVGCFGCILDNTSGVTTTEVSELNDAIAQLQAACASAGQTVSAASLTAPSGAASGAASDTGLSGAIATATGASFTSASGGLTLGGSAASSAAATSAAATSAAGSAAASVTGAAGSAAGSATGAAGSAAASATGAAGVGAPLPNFVGVAMGLIGLGAGAAFIL